MKARGRKPKQVAVKSTTNNGVMEMSRPIPHLYNPNEKPNNALQHFITVQSHHMIRLQYLFPEINPGALRKILDLCNGDFIRTIDYFLSIRRKKSMMKNQTLPVTTGIYENNQVPVPSFSTLPASSHMNNTYLGQISGNNVPHFAQQNINTSINQNYPHSNYQMNLNTTQRDVNASNLKNSPVFTIPTFHQRQTPINIQTLPCQSIPNQINQRTNVMLPPFESLASPLKVAQQINSNGTGKQDSNFCTPYMLEKSQVIGNSMTSIGEQQVEYSNNDPFDASFSKDMFKTTPEILSQRQRENNWMQQQQQKLEESQLFNLLSGDQMQKNEQAVTPVFPSVTYEEKSFENPLEMCLSKGAECNKQIENSELKNNSGSGMEPENKNEIGNSSGIDYNFLFDMKTSVKRKLFQSYSTEKDSSLQNQGNTNIMQKKSQKDEITKKNLVSKQKNVKLTGDELEKKGQEELTSLKKDESINADGNNSWGFLDETYSPSNNPLIIDTDSDINTSEEIRDKGDK